MPIIIYSSPDEIEKKKLQERRTLRQKGCAMEYTGSVIAFTCERFPSLLKKISSQNKLSLSYKRLVVGWLGQKEYIFTVTGEQDKIESFVKQFDRHVVCPPEVKDV